MYTNPNKPSKLNQSGRVLIDTNHMSLAEWNNSRQKKKEDILLIPRHWQKPAIKRVDRRPIWSTADISLLFSSLHTRSPTYAKKTFRSSKNLSVCSKLSSY